MRILLDECLPWKLGRELAGHEVRTVQQMGWAGIKNGELLERAEARFDVFLTVDRNLSFQQETTRFDLAVVILSARRNTLELLAPLIPNALTALARLRPGEVVRIASAPPRRAG